MKKTKDFSSVVMNQNSYNSKSIRTLETSNAKFVNPSLTNRQFASSHTSDQFILIDSPCEPKHAQIKTTRLNMLKLKPDYARSSTVVPPLVFPRQESTTFVASSTRDV